MEEIIILGKSIINDIRMMDKKSLDISLIQDDKSDITFFNIDEEESNETLKALKQSYVTTNYKEETILNLQNTLNSSSDDASKELKIESYKKYNEALNLASRNYITTATEIIEKASELNPKDVDILNLRGLLKLLKCDFSKSFESFYTAMCYGNNELSRKYVDILSSDEFKVFLGRYNHSIRFINEDLNQESIHILNNIILAISMVAYHISNKNKIESLNAQLNKKDEKIEEIDKQLSETSEKLDETNQELDKTNQQLDEAKKQEMLVSSEVDLYQKALELKASKNYKDAITYFKKVIEYGKTKKYISESIYQVAFLSEKTKNYDQAVKYYKKYINTYTKEDQYYDDAFYQLGMLYYENGDLENAKKTFYGMRSEVPDSMYNNSKVKEILSK